MANEISGIYNIYINIVYSFTLTCLCIVYVLSMERIRKTEYSQYCVSTLHLFDPNFNIKTNLMVKNNYCVYQFNIDIFQLLVCLFDFTSLEHYILTKTSTSTFWPAHRLNTCESSIHVIYFRFSILGTHFYFSFVHVHPVLWQITYIIQKINVCGKLNCLF